MTKSEAAKGRDSLTASDRGLKVGMRGYVLLFDHFGSAIHLDGQIVSLHGSAIRVLVTGGIGIRGMLDIAHELFIVSVDPSPPLEEAVNGRWGKRPSDGRTKP